MRSHAQLITGARARMRSLYLNTYFIGLLLVSAATLAWSSAGLFTRLIPLDSWTMLLWRGVFGGIALVLVCAIKNGSFTVADYFNLGIAGWFFVFVSAIGMVFFITSLTLTTKLKQ